MRSIEVRMMSGVLLVFLILLGSASLYANPASQKDATAASQKAFLGCLTRLPDGTLQFGAVPSGELFLLGGQTNILEGHVKQLVRVYGETAPRGSDNNALPTLVVVRVQALSNSCTSVLPAKQLDGVPGKVGEDAVAVPLTSTFTENQSTPGLQTEAAIAQSSPAIEPPAAPPYPEQVGQSEAAANVDAGSVERTEILPGRTLGVSGTVAAPGTVATGGAAVAFAAKSPSPPVVVKISGDAAPKLSPPRVTIRRGQTVEWINSSSTMQELIANPSRATQLSGAKLPADAKPFDSGFLRHGHTFEHHFSVPGVYHYLCKVNNLTSPVQAVGEVIVQR
jgi:plastocyanin